jgi:hypothetical protein
MSTSDVTTAASTSGAAPFSLEAHFPMELLLLIIGMLEPLAYLKLSQTSRSMRQLLKQPEHLHRLVRRPNSRTRRWEGRFSDPVWEQLVLRAYVGPQARWDKKEGRAAQDPLRIRMSNLTLIAAASIGSSGRYVAFLTPEHEVRKWDLFMRREVHIPQLHGDMWHTRPENTDSGRFESGHGHDCRDLEIELHDDDDLLIVKDSSCWGVWDLKYADRPMISESRAEMDRNELSNNLTRALLYDHRGTLHAPRIRDRDTRPVWRGVKAWAAARCSSALLIYGQNVQDPEMSDSWDGLQLWDIDTQQLVQSKPLAHLQLPPGTEGDLLPSVLYLSDDGTRAVYLDNGVQPPPRRIWNQPAPEPVQPVTKLRSWSLSDPEWPVTIFDDELNDEEGLDSLSPDGHFRIAISRHGTIRVFDLSGQKPMFAVRAGAYVMPLLDFGPWKRTVPWHRVRQPLIALLSQRLISEDPRRYLHALKEMPLGAFVSADGPEIQALLNAGTEVLGRDYVPVLRNEKTTEEWDWRLAAVDAHDDWMLTSDRCGPIFCRIDGDLAATKDGWCLIPGCFTCDIDAMDLHGLR